MSDNTLKDIFREAEKYQEEAYQRLSIIAGRMEELEGRSKTVVNSSDILELLSEVRKTRSDLKNLKIEVKKSMRELLARASAISKEAGDDSLFNDIKEYIEDEIDEFEGRVEELEEKADGLIDRLRDALHEMRGRSRFPIVAVASQPGKVNIVRGDFRVLDEALREVDRIIREALSGLWMKTPSTIISSVRLPQADLNVIDLLVEAGIFKSRNEGIAFFVHKGIESSRDWLEKVRSKIEEIKRLQEETRKELESLLGSEEEKKEEKPQ